MPGIESIKKEYRDNKPTRKVSRKQRVSKRGKVHKEIVYGSYIEDLFEKHFVSSSMSHPGTISAGMFGSGPRQMYLKYTGQLIGNYDLRSHRYMGNGNSAHDRWEKDLGSLGILVGSEGNVHHPTLPIRGRYDSIISHPDKGKLLVELKTIGKKVEEMKEPQFAHIAQWALYSDVLDIDTGWIIYENRETVEPFYFPLHRRGSDMDIYDFSGNLQYTMKSLLDDLYNNVKFAIWCVENDKFPKDKCDECVQWGCKQPDSCMQLEAEKELISLEGWLNRN